MTMACLAALFAGCTQAPEATTVAAQPADATFQDFGDYEVHFNALRSDALTQEVAAAYGIQRSTNRVMLTVTVLHKQADRAPRKPVDAEVQVDAYNLNGQLKNMEVRRISEGDAIYYIGDGGISGAEILVFDIAVKPDGVAAPMKVKFKREFYAS
jgi:hypothetical protein